MMISLPMDIQNHNRIHISKLDTTKHDSKYDQLVISPRAKSYKSMFNIPESDDLQRPVVETSGEAIGYLESEIQISCKKDNPPPVSIPGVSHYKFDREVFLFLATITSLGFIVFYAVWQMFKSMNTLSSKF